MLAFLEEKIQRGEAFLKLAKLERERDRGDEKMIKDWKSIWKREEKRHNVNYRVGISESLDLFRDNT